MKNWGFCCLSDSAVFGCIVWNMEWMNGLSASLQKELLSLKSLLCDVRLFAGRSGFAVTLDGEKALQTVTDARELYDTVQRMCDHMLRVSPEKTSQGYITLRGGHRLGLCGRVTRRDDQLILQEIGSVCIRVAHQIKDCGRDTAALFMQTGQGMMICGAPGSGKTTLLRDTVRRISDAGAAVGLSDERGEIAACALGVPQLDVGSHTHVLDGCDKAQALRWLLRGMCPQVLAMDELYGAEECAAVREASACGVRTIATVHAGSAREVCRREGIAKLLEERVFGYVVFVKNRKVTDMLSAEEALCCGR